jgi:hypothetical protein
VGSGFVYNPTGSPWTFSTNSGVAGDGNSVMGGNPPAPQGTQVAVLTANGTISQAINFAAGTYTVSFYAAQRVANLYGDQSFGVAVDAQSVGMFTPGGGAYSVYTTNPFTVTAGSHTLTFFSQPLPRGQSFAFLDQVSISTSPADLRGSGGGTTGPRLVSFPGGTGDLPGRATSGSVEPGGPSLPSAPVGSVNQAVNFTTNMFSSFFSFGDMIRSDLLFAQAELNQFLQVSETLMQPSWLTQLLAQFQQQATVGPLAKLIEQDWLNALASGRMT